MRQQSPPRAHAIPAVLAAGACMCGADPNSSEHKSGARRPHLATTAGLSFRTMPAMARSASTCVCVCVCVCVSVSVVASWHRRVSRACGPRVAMLTAVSPGCLLRSAASWPLSPTRACTTPPTPSRRLSRPCPRLRPSRRRAQASPRAPHRPPPATPTTTALLRRRPAATA